MLSFYPYCMSNNFVERLLRKIMWVDSRSHCAHFYTKSSHWVPTNHYSSNYIYLSTCINPLTSTMWPFNRGLHKSNSCYVTPVGTFIYNNVRNKVWDWWFGPLHFQVQLILCKNVELLPHSPLSPILHKMNQIQHLISPHELCKFFHPSKTLFCGRSTVS